MLVMNLCILVMVSRCSNLYYAQDKFVHFHIRCRIEHIILSVNRTVLRVDISVHTRRYLRPCPQISPPVPADISVRDLSYPDYTSRENIHQMHKIGK